MAPVLTEAWRLGAGPIALYSGMAFDVDPAADLTGECDFILGHPPQLDTVSVPVLLVTEAKNVSIMGGLG